MKWRRGGKTTFVDAVLAGETVSLRYTRRRGCHAESIAVFESAGA